MQAHKYRVRATTTGLILWFAFASVAQAGDAALVVRNAVVWTADADTPTAEALAVADGRFVYVGANAGVAFAEGFVVRQPLLRTTLLRD